MQSLVIGIAGGTGSGKTTFANRIAAALPDHAVAVLDHDAYYRDRPELSFDERAAVNFDHPDALETSLFVTHLEALKRGESVDVPSYDFTRHMRLVETRHVSPRAVLIVEGILVLADARLRASFDIKVFVDTDADIRIMRRVRRDMQQRGRSFESVREQYYRTVRPMHLEFVEPSKRFADLIVPEGGNNGVALDLLVHKARSAAATYERERSSYEPNRTTAVEVRAG